MTHAWRELLRFAALALLVLTAVLLAGQAARLGDLAAWSPAWPRALGLGGVVLLEAVLPLVALVAAGLAYGRLRAEGVLIARAALGIGPLRLFGPPALLGLLCGGIGIAVSGRIGPAAVAELGAVLVDAASRATLGGGSRALPRGGAIRGGAELWAVVPERAGGAAPVLVHAAAARLDPTGGDVALVLDDAWIWGGGLRARVGAAHLAGMAVGADRLGAFGPPNATPTADLGDDPRGRFVRQRRLALPAAAPLWGILGALLGGAFGGAVASIAGAGLVGLAYWLLRAGELAARAGSFSPVWAAWAPVLALLVVIAIGWRPLSRRLE